LKSTWDGASACQLLVFSNQQPPELSRATYADEDALALEVNVLDRELVGQRHFDGSGTQLVRNDCSSSQKKARIQDSRVFGLGWQVKDAEVMS
jgi:hypothetical protein